jgi:catechol 2,3-dioxygenase-like lactoylglutathione lyase family enzyme
MSKGLALAAVAAAWMMAGAALGAPPAELKPRQVEGPGLYVTDLEAQRAWYEAKLGMVVANTIKRGDQPFEYVMGFGGQPGSPILALAKSQSRPAGPNAFSRVILGVPNAKGLADWLKGQGVESREVIPNVAYFIRDPEGNPVELYTPPKP